MGGRCTCGTRTREEDGYQETVFLFPLSSVARLLLSPGGGGLTYKESGKGLYRRLCSGLNEMERGGIVRDTE